VIELAKESKLPPLLLDLLFGEYGERFWLPQQIEEIQATENQDCEDGECDQASFLAEDWWATTDRPACGFYAFAGLGY
jgi:hypothetical protein